MRQSVIILPSDLSGSSVLTGLLARGGYWAGDATFKKQQHETLENQAFIDLNASSLKDRVYGQLRAEFSADAGQEIAEGNVDLSEELL
jgi:hypothetical protein